jgi:peptidoglycan/LPS O-acetylase OafA/YrhL
LDYHIGVGFCVARSTTMGNAKASERGTSNGELPRFYFYLKRVPVNGSFHARTPMSNYCNLFLPSLTAVILSLLAYLKLRRCNTPADFHPFDTNATLPVRGILAILIVCHHLSLYFHDASFAIFKNWGTAIVSVFFFISGYGLMVSYLKKGKSYLTNFFRHRFSKLLPTFLLLTIGCGIYHYKSHFISAIAHDFLIGLPTLPNSWFLYVIFYFYIAFYISCRASRSNVQCIGYMALFTLLSMAMTLLAKFGSWWYVSQPSIVLGLIVAVHEEWVKKSLCRHPFAIIFPIILISLLSYFFIPNTALKTLTFSNLAPLLVLFTLYAYPPIRNKVIRYLGKVSLEIYLVHGLVISVMHKIGGLCGCPVLPWYVFTVLTFILTIPLAALAHQFNQAISSRF